MDSGALPYVRLLMTTPARTVMRTEVIRVPTSRSVARVLCFAAGLDRPTYVLTLLDGRECGIALVEQIRAIPESEAHHTPIYAVARPISYAKCLSREDAVIEAFRTLKRGLDDFVAELDASDQVAGVITRDDLARALARSMFRERPRPSPGILNCRWQRETAGYV
jgi:CBS-domain-containing membrane protein